jgi:hypothetical protein
LVVGDLCLDLPVLAQRQFEIALGQTCFSFRLIPQFSPPLLDVVGLCLRFLQLLFKALLSEMQITVCKPQFLLDNTP